MKRPKLVICPTPIGGWGHLEKWVKAEPNIEEVLLKTRGPSKARMNFYRETGLDLEQLCDGNTK